METLYELKKTIMGQKANVNSLNISSSIDWSSSWFIFNSEYKKLLFQDLFILSCCKNLNITKVRILRYSKVIIVYIYVIHFPNNLFISLMINFVQKSNDKHFETIILVFRRHSFYLLSTCASFCALQICLFIEKRLKFKSNVTKVFLKKIVSRNIGVKAKCKGRLNNVDMAKSEFMLEGKVPLQSYSKPISYGFCVANTLKGLQSIKVWLLRNNDCTQKN